MNKDIDDIKEDIHEGFENVAKQLKIDRDELNLQIHLAEAEVRIEWQEIETKWQHFVATGKRMGEATGESSKEIDSALELLGEELKNAYKKIKKSI